MEGPPESWYKFTEADSEHHGKVLCIKALHSNEHVFIDDEGGIFTCRTFGPEGNKVVGLVARKTGMNDLIYLAQEMRRRGVENPCATRLLLETEKWE